MNIAQFKHPLPVGHYNSLSSKFRFSHVQLSQPNAVSAVLQKWGLCSSLFKVLNHKNVDCVVHYLADMNGHLEV